MTISGKTAALTVLEKMYQARFVEEKMQKLVRQNKGGSFHLFCGGHEMIGILSGTTLISGKDWGLPYYRDRAFAIGLGVPLVEIFAGLLARDCGHHSSGRMMPEHFSHKELRIPVQSSVVGSQYLHAVGLAKGLPQGEVVYVSGGDGSTSQGDFHEALNYACIYSLPVIFVIQDNEWAISVTPEEQTAGGKTGEFAKSYIGLDVHTIDGCDFEETSTTLSTAADRARKGNGPTLIVAKVPRLGPHSSSDDPKKYSTEEALEAQAARDPLPRFEQWLIDMGLSSEQELETIRRRIFNEVEEAAKAADALPSPKAETAGERVFKDVTVTEAPPLERGEPIVIMDALNHALAEEMERDDKVIVFGQDVARGKGGVFGITRTLTERFGNDRCFNTPLAESTIIGTAIGLSFAGYTSVAEVQFADYLWTGINQLFNELSSIYYRSNGEWNCPVTIRLPYGGYIQGGPYHSQSIEAFLAHCPGLKVVIPSNAADAKMLLKSAIRDPNPVLFLEHKALYRQRLYCAQPEPTKDELLPFGKANIVKEGEDVTLVCWGMMVHMAFEVAQQLAKEDITVEIIDLRTLNPLDTDTILTSVEKTGKLLIAHEAPLNCGFGAEIAARIAELGFSTLDAPVKRLGGLDCPVPYAKELEDRVLPQKADLEKAIRDLVDF